MRFLHQLGGRQLAIGSPLPSQFPIQVDAGQDLGDARQPRGAPIFNLRRKPVTVCHRPLRVSPKICKSGKFRSRDHMVIRTSPSTPTFYTLRSPQTHLSFKMQTPKSHICRLDLLTSTPPPSGGLIVSASRRRYHQEQIFFAHMNKSF